MTDRTHSGSGRLGVCSLEKTQKFCVYSGIVSGLRCVNCDQVEKERKSEIKIEVAASNFRERP